MKEKEDILTFDEVEQLCRLYLECGLSRLEEAELEYLLLNVPYRSSVIDAVREDIRIGCYAIRMPYLSGYHGLSVATRSTMSIAIPKSENQADPTDRSLQSYAISDYRL